MSGHIDLNNTAAAQALATPPKRGRGRPRKNPPPHVHPRPPDSSPGTGASARAVAGFAPGDMVWGKKLNHAAWPGLVYSAGADGDGHDGQLLVSYFGDKAFAWCDAAELRPYEPYFPIAELYDDGGEDFDAAIEASLHEFSRRVQAALLTTAPAAHPFAPADFIALLHTLAADRTGFTNRLQAAVAKAHLRAFDDFRGLPDPPQFTLDLGLLPVPDSSPSPITFDSTTHSGRRRGRKRKDQAINDDDSDEDWDPRKKGATDSESDLDFDRRRGSRGRGTATGAPRGRPRGRPRKTDAAMGEREPQGKDDQEILDYPSVTDMFLHLLSVAADPVNGNYGSVPLIVSFFSKHKDSQAPSVYQDKELLETFGGKKGRKRSAGSSCAAAKAEADNDHEQSVTADGQRGRRKSAGGIYSARKAEDSYWCDIIISDFDDGDSDYEGRKRKRPSQNKSASKKMKQEEPSQDGASTDPPPDAKPAEGPAALILHFSSPEAIPSVDDINSIFRVHGPIVEHETQITKKSKIAKVVFSKSADAERAFSSSGKYNAFGSSLLTYEIEYLPSAPQVS